MNDSTAKDLYDKWHNQIDEFGEDNYNSPWHLMVRQYLGDLSGLKVLEIGCGRGGFSKYLLECGADLVAADFSDAAIEITKGFLQNWPRCEVMVADIQNIPFPDNTFDCVISLETLEHIPDPDRGLAELVRVTKAGGRTMVTTPNYLSSLGVLRVYRELTGRPFTEVGQPINHPLKLIDRVLKLKQLKCRIDVIDGVGHYLYVPGTPSRRIKWLDRPRAISKWFAVHSLTVATKL
ncbi:MAG: class I SAM-dependent methyltransferase [Cyanosarcina radialis HA8281-LM2]|jgi:ubiquinone/menaquinone biosynthesis C-methylase UbiE|nr:class I SAM-dependent methyltransferase [Cyanosarcina radialis HA8281-LM2]